MIHSVAIALALLGLACGKARETPSVGATECNRCHGSLANAAPPSSTHGATVQTDIGVGAHQAHVADGPVSLPIPCETCHIVPTSVDAPGHMDGAHATVTFTGLAVANGASPVWNRETASCSATYCHGGTLRGGRTPAPVWTAGPSQARCGGCHGVPPPKPHVQNLDCNRCHPGYQLGGIVRATHVNGQVDHVALACDTCHGGSGSPAPPMGTAGETDTTALAVGAHQAHLRDGALRAALACTECHVVPTDVLHATGTVELTWGPLATAGGAAPVWDRGAATCASTYCHGATLGAGGGLQTPVWTKVDGTQAACGTCHGNPPPLPHPPNPDCNRCHPLTVLASGAIDIAGGHHIDGRVDVAPLGCSLCHGSSVNPAPPIGTRGETATTALAVGAHQAHVRDGVLRQALACSDCHVVPTQMLHANGTVDMAWGALATTGGAAPIFDAASATCASTYCHGATLGAGGALVTPVWTKVDGTQAACGTCHGNPPPAPHPPNPDCNRCHPQTVLSGGAIDVAGGHHIDGRVDVAPLGCSLCHGSSVNPAPPIGTRGETATTALAVGAHQAHVRDGALRQALACSDCHVVPTQMLHANGTVDLTFGALATTGGAVPVFSAANATCASTYCHGATLKAGGTLVTPVWTKVDGTQAACGTCHGNPPSSPHPVNSQCNGCHPATVLADGTIDVAGGHHIDGKLDLVGLTCHACHGSDVNPAPPLGTHGETATTTLAVGAHQAHVRDGPLRQAIACTECHPLPTQIVHSNGVVDLVWGPLATTGGAAPVFSAASATCASTYCHGATLAAGGTLVTPVWTKVDGTQAACGTCHGNPPPLPHPSDTRCYRCHDQTVNTDGTINVAGGKHIDGTIEVAGGGCSACHGSALNPAPPLGTNGETATTTLAVGAHQAHVTDGVLRKALGCGDCHVVPSQPLHANGTVDMAWSALATTGGASPVFSAASATCASTYCHGATLAGGGTLVTPVWTKVDGTQAACGTCHGTPPPAPHPPNPLCNSCHPLTVGIDGTIDVAGGRHIDGNVDVISLTCTSCHGSTANPAPPAGTRGETATTTLAVGAHQAHLRDGPLRQALACGDCHTVPTQMLHASGTVDLTWGPLARMGGASPVFSAATATCASTYCHGATLGAGGALVTPVWTKVDGTQAACGTCHGNPPPLPHPSDTRCYRCHPQTVNTDGTINVAGGRHIDGAIEVAGGCSLCHGSTANPAPPLGTHGETTTTTLAVGAHQAHVTDGVLRKALGCGDCHPVPTQLLHSNGVVDLVWGPLATAGGAAPAFSAGGATCASTYCHGATLAAGGTLVTPVWTTVDGTQAACGTCHGAPPPAPHPPNPLCNSCHPLTVGIDGKIDVAGGRHIDGSVDVAGLTCSSCHGSTANPAPPTGTRGETATTDLAVGAHQAHLRDGPFRQALACGDCHTVPTQMLHANGTVDLTFGPLAKAGGASPVFSAATATCASTYCHGASLRGGGGTLVTPIWTKVDGTQAACGTCHGNPPPAPHPAVAAGQCAPCHPQTVNADGTIDVAGGHHIDGRLDASADCGVCHGVPPANGAHLAHAAFSSPTIPVYGDLRILADYAPSGGPAYQFGCGHCHPIDPAKHMDFVLEVELSPAAAAPGSLKSRNAPDAAYDAGTGKCSGVYCHSSGQAAPAFAATPGWTSGTKLGCSGCHGNPPAYPSGGAGAPGANGHLGLADTGREFGHFVGLGGPLHDTKHGGGVYGTGQAAAPITCQTCHFATTDPSSTGPSGFYWLDTTGTYALPGGDPARLNDPRWRASQCGTCHGPAPGQAPVGQGKVLPLTHVNGRRDVVFDPRTALPPYALLPPAPDSPTRPYWVTHIEFCPALPTGAGLDGTTLSLELSSARWDPATKTCSSVPCHLTDAPVWGRSYLTKPGAQPTSCCRCHGERCGP